MKKSQNIVARFKDFVVVGLLLLSVTVSFGQSINSELDEALLKCAECVEERKALLIVISNLEGVVSAKDQQLDVKSQIIVNMENIQTELESLVLKLKQIISDQDKDRKRQKLRSFFNGVLTGLVAALAAVLLL